MYRWLNLKRYFGCGKCDSPTTPGDSGVDYRKPFAECEKIKGDFDILWDTRL